MDFKNRLLNQLFGIKSKKIPEEPSVVPPTTTAVAEEPVKTAAPPPIDFKLLELPDEHALHKLYFLWNRQADGAPVPLLRLDGHDALTPDETERELLRLQKELTTASVSRLKEAEPKEPGRQGDTKQDNETSGEQEEELPPPTLDARPFVFVSSDRLAAWLMVFPPTGQGRELDRGMLDNALAENRISYGVDTELLDRLPQDPGRYFHLFYAAKGTPVTHGKDGYIEDFYSRSVQQKFVADEHDRVDYFNLNLFQNIEKGTVICQAIPPVKGIPGRTIYNEEIPCKDGKEAALPKGQNTVVSEDGTKLCASLSGRVEFSGRSFHVKTVLDINGNVDLSTGHINYMGDVHIHGDVCSGFSVRAVGDVTIDGVVEAGEIEAGGDLRVAKGILGDSRVVIRSRRNLYAKYIENCIVHVRKNLAADYLANCDVYCDGDIQAVTGRGILLGGKIRAARNITAKTVGSRSENHTTIFLGGQPCADFERESLQQNIHELKEALKKAERQPAGPAREKQMNKLRLELSVRKMKLAQFDKDLEKSKEALEQQGGCRLKCDIAYPGLILSINNVTLHLAQETSCLNGRLVNGEIQVL